MPAPLAHSLTSCLNIVCNSFNIARFFRPLSPVYLCVDWLERRAIDLDDLSKDGLP